MNKKILLFAIVLIFSVGLAGIVYSSQEEKSISIYKSWNLLHFGFLSSSNDNGEVKLSNFKYAYIFDPNEKEYVLAWNNGDWTNEMKNKYNFKRGESNWLTSSSVWVYSDKTGTMKIWVDGGDIPIFDLSNGWNFIGIVPGMIGKTLNEIKGNCNIVKVAGWEPGDQEWDDSVPTGKSFLDEKFTSDSLGMGFVMKVSNNCKLGTPSVKNNIPSVPKLPDTITKKCTDTDGGKDYYIKGVVNGYNEDAPVREITSVSDSCSGNVLHEWECKNSDEFDDDSYTCPKGCSNGACIK